MHLHRTQTTIFSKDTINSDDYLYPRIDFEQIQNGSIFGYSKQGEEHKLVRIKVVKNKFTTEETREYFLTDPEQPHPLDYWNLLSKQAVLTGGGGWWGCF